LSFNYQIRFAKTGRARFIAHLDTLSILVRAVRRTGYDLAFTQGMRPKPVLSLAMPLGVGVEGEDEICDFALEQRVPLTEFAKALSAEMPEGMELKSIGPCHDRTKSAARVELVSYRVELTAAPAALPAAVTRFNEAAELVVLRRRPKGDKEVDVKKYVDTVSLEPDTGILVFDMRVTAEGTARPEEVIELLAGFAAEELAARRVVRTSIVLKDEAPPAPNRGRGYRGRKRH
jgi:radical SAM-linked protein